MNTELYKTIVPVKTFFSDIHLNAIKKGFWNGDNNLSEKILLVITELAEAVEAMRKTDIDHLLLENSKHSQLAMAIVGRLNAGTYDDNMDGYNNEFKTTLKDTVGDEFADAVIRIIDLSLMMGIDLWSHMIAKTEYNKSREYMHGKEF
jgi:NTP pyrophosphatase (non-canonical NTP hydrolase)